MNSEKKTFKNVKEILKRDEMKKVTAGYGWVSMCSGGSTHWYYCGPYGGCQYWHSQSGCYA